MSQQAIEACVKDTLARYLDDLSDTEPQALYELIVRSVEKPMLELVMDRANQNQSRAADWLGLNRNTLRKKLLDHKLAS
jgi:Fis family transcriptional regulator, factor for inversion stimulation protein